jgi:hypothetical protein
MGRKILCKVKCQRVLTPLFRAAVFTTIHQPLAVAEVGHAHVAKLYAVIDSRYLSPALAVDVSDSS